MCNVFVTLYGKSGIGKTSLLNAGVFPELRREQYIPISIRLGIREEEHPQSYQTMIIEAIERKVNSIETINVIKEQTDLQSVDYLWNYFARHRFYDKDNEITTPVIVFDQFEEVFRGHREEAETLLRQLDFLNDKDHTLDSCKVNGLFYHYEQNFRFVVSIREDDLYRLEDSIDNCYLPALKRCRFRLRSLSEEGARDVILIPGGGLFDAIEKDSIVKAINSKSLNDDGSISTNIISLLCSRIYVDFMRTGANVITTSLVENFIKGNPFEQFYNEATQGFSNKEKNYIETHLVDSNSRRNTIPESDFLLHVKNGVKLLEGKNRILQRVSTSSDGKCNRIELIHDSFCEPLSVLKKKREQRRRLMTYSVSVAIVLICLCVSALIISQRDTISQNEKNLEIKNAELKSINIQLERKNKEIEIEKNTALLACQERGLAIRDLERVKHQLEIKNKEISDEKYATILAYNEKNKAFAELKIANETLQKNLIKSRALEISNHLVDGRLNETIDTLINLLPNESNPDIPYVAEVEQVLRQAYDSLRYGNSSIHRFVGKDCFRYAVYSPNDRYIAAASNDSSVILWDAKTYEKKYILRGHNDIVDCVNFSPDGKKLVSYAYDGSLYVWNVESGKKIFSYDMFANARKRGVINEDDDYRCSGRCEFDHKGNRIIAAIGGGIGCHIIDLTTGLLKYVLAKGVNGTTSLSAHFMPNNVDVITNVTGDLLIWKPETNDTLLLVRSKSKYDIKNPIISKDGKMIAYSEGEFVKIISIDGALLKSIYLGYSTYEMDFSNNSEYIASATYDPHGLINIIDVEEGKIVKSQSENKYLVLSAKFSYDDRHLVTACVDNSCRIFNTGLYPYRFIPNETNILWNQDDDTVHIINETIIEDRFWWGGTHNSVLNDTIISVCVGNDKIDDVIYKNTDCIIMRSRNTLKLLNSKGVTRKIWVTNDSVASMDVSLDNNYLVYVVQDEKKKKSLIKVVRLSDFSVINKFYTDFYVWVAKFAKDDRLWLAGNNAVFVYSVFTGECLGKGYGDNEDCIIYEGLNIDGKHFLTYNPTDIDDMSLKVWNINDLSLVWKISGFSRKPDNSAFGMDGNTIITSNFEDGTRLYKFTPLSEIIDKCMEFFGK